MLILYYSLLFLVDEQKTTAKNLWVKQIEAFFIVFILLACWHFGAKQIKRHMSAFWVRL